MLLCSDEVRAGSFCLCARPFVSFAECYYRGLCVRRGEEMRVVFRRRAVAVECRRWWWWNGELALIDRVHTLVKLSELLVAHTRLVPRDSLNIKTSHPAAGLGVHVSCHACCSCS